MTIEEFKASLQPELLEKVKAACEKTQDVNEADAKTIYDFFMEVAAPALGEDQVAEPFRYITAAVNGMRTKDLEAVIGEDFNAEVFEQLRTQLGFELLVTRNLVDQVVVDFAFPPIRMMMQKLLGENSYKACASDIGYHLLQNYGPEDPVRGIQTMHLLLDGDDAAAAAEYISQAEGEPLRLATLTMGNGLKDAPEYVKQCIYDMPLVQSEKVNVKKLLMLLLNDCVAIVSDPQKQMEVTDKLHEVVANVIQNGDEDVTVLLGVAKLRIAQNERILAQQAHQQKKEEDAHEHEQGAQHVFMDALNYLMPPLQQADPETISDEQIRQYWLCLKICQEMAQPKAISLFFESIVKVEQAQVAAIAQKMRETGEDSLNEEDSKRAEELGTRIIDQHIDLSKLYYQLPQPLQEQFTNYSDAAISLITAYIDGIKDNEDRNEENDMALQLRLCNYYQTIGELQNHLGRDEESYEAYTEAQIRQMRHLAAVKRQDEEIAEKNNRPGFMSQDGLITRLTLSVTNHMLGMYYRKQGKADRDLAVLLRSNMDLAMDCFKAYPRDGRVVHFIINAALELGDMQHKEKGIMAECGTYEKVIRQFPALNNMRLDPQLIADLAMIHTKCGQVQGDNSIRRFGDAQRNLTTALNLWSMLAKNTNNPEFKKNAENVQNLLNQLKK